MSKILRMSEVIDRTGLSRAKIYDMLKTGKEFPKPFKLTETGRMIGWTETQIDSWIDSVSNANQARQA